MRVRAAYSGREIQVSTPVLAGPGRRCVQQQLADALTTLALGDHQVLQPAARAYPMHVVVGSGETGLDGRSTILLEQIQTVAVERLGRRVGQLSPQAMQEVDRALHYSLGLMD